MTGELRQLIRPYLLLVGAGLLLEGSALLLATVIHLAIPFTLDTPHNVLHVVWGLLILGVLATSRAPRTISTIALVFGVFYTLLAIAGVWFTNPFGLSLGPGENIFHFVVGSSSLAAGALSQFRWRKVVTITGASGH
jgi:hypothetical protein